MSLSSFFKKVREKGALGLLKAVGRFLHYTFLKTPWDFKLIPNHLNLLISQEKQLIIIQVGANVGNTESDPLCRFLLENANRTLPSGSPMIKAILVEPVPVLFKELTANYSKVPGVILVNLAIAESAGFRDFYGLRPGIDLKKHGLPPWSYQLGSFLPMQIESFLHFAPHDANLRAFVEKNIQKEKIMCEPLSRLCEIYSLPWLDFLQIDTEGYDYRVLQTLDFDKLRPALINYERIHLKKDEPACRRLLSSRGYFLFDHGQDTLAICRTNIPKSKKFQEWLYCKWLDFIY